MTRGKYVTKINLNLRNHKEKRLDFHDFRLACPCGKFEEFRQPLRSIQQEYYDEVNELIESGRYDSRDDFTVVLQTMFVDMQPLTLVFIYNY